MTSNPMLDYFASLSIPQADPSNNGIGGDANGLPPREYPIPIGQYQNYGGDWSHYGESPQGEWNFFGGPTSYVGRGPIPAGAGTTGQNTSYTLNFDPAVYQQLMHNGTPGDAAKYKLFFHNGVATWNGNSPLPAGVVPPTSADSTSATPSAAAANTLLQGGGQNLTAFGQMSGGGQAAATPSKQDIYSHLAQQGLTPVQINNFMRTGSVGAAYGGGQAGVNTAGNDTGPWTSQASNSGGFQPGHGGAQGGMSNTTAGSLGNLGATAPGAATPVDKTLGQFAGHAMFGLGLATNPASALGSMAANALAGSNITGGWTGLLDHVLGLDLGLEGTPGSYKGDPATGGTSGSDVGGGFGGHGEVGGPGDHH